MEESYTPEKVYYEVLRNNLNQKAATEILVSLLEKSDKVHIITKCIEIIGKLKLTNVHVFKILENYMLSDENSLVRNSSIEVASKLFPKMTLVPLNWVIHNDTAALVLGKCIEVISNQIGLEYDSLKKNLINRLQKIYDVKKEVFLFLNLDIIYSELSNNVNFKAGQSWHKIMKMVTSYSDFIGLIPRLYYLKSGGVNLTPLPLSINNLEFFRSLFLKKNKLMFNHTGRERIGYSS